jgi:hypothetical protein
VTDSSGAVHFPPVHDVRDPAGAAAPAQSDTHDYHVHQNDSLWKIAKTSLTHGHRHVHVTGEEVWSRIHDIVELNKAEHKELIDNPFYVWKGEHLTIPGAPGAPEVQVAHHGRREGSAVARSGTAPAASDSPITPRADATPVADGGHLASALKGEAAHQAHRIGTIGDCARGPRQTLEHFGISLRPMAAVKQGELLERSGMFDRVPASEAKEGDYGYRHWSAHTIKRRGLGDLGDSFIVTNCSTRGLQAANDHMFTVPPGGGYYAPGITFLRPNAKFYAAYQHYQQTGEKTHLS